MKILSVFISLFFVMTAHAKNQFQVTIQNQPKATHRYSYNFPTTSPNMISYLDLVITNTGDSVGKRTDFWISGMWYSADTNCPVEMQPGSKCQVTVRYWPQMEGIHYGTMGMEFADDENIIVDLSGWCR